MLISSYTLQCRSQSRQPRFASHVHQMDVYFYDGDSHSNLTNMEYRTMQAWCAGEFGPQRMRWVSYMESTELTYMPALSHITVVAFVNEGDALLFAMHWHGITEQAFADTIGQSR